ncbi:MAG: hypothetical protein ACLFVP_05145 [Candidatus Bathyarchaeia archaeon]
MDKIMDFTEFRHTTLEFWNEYFNKISTLISSGQVSLKKGSLFYPNIVLFTKTDDHYISEFFGATKEYEGLEEKIHKQESIVKYLYQFETADKTADPLFNFGGRNNGLIWILLSRSKDFDKIKQRFKFIDPWGTKFIREGPLISFTSKFQSQFLDSCLIVNSYEEIYRVKHILHMWIISKTHSKEDYRDDLENLSNRSLRTTNNIFGVHYIPERPYEGYVLAGQFANLFLMPGLRETTIGKFLEKNPIYIKGAQL